MKSISGDKKVIVEFANCTIVVARGIIDEGEKIVRGAIKVDKSCENFPYEDFVEIAQQQCSKSGSSCCTFTLSGASRTLNGTSGSVDDDEIMWCDKRSDDIIEKIRQKRLEELEEIEFIFNEKSVAGYDKFLHRSEKKIIKGFERKEQKRVFKEQKSRYKERRFYNER